MVTIPQCCAVADMAIRKKLRVGWFLAGSVLLSACYVATHYRAWQYRGGRLIDNGVLSRPRYLAQFADIPFNVPATYTHTFSRFPGSDAVVMLSTPSEPSDGSIEKLTTLLRLRVVDQDGQVLCDGSGSPRGTGHSQLLVTSSGGKTIGLWHTRCALLELRACNPCLHISVGPVDSATPRLGLVPTLQGGGVELP